MRMCKIFVVVILAVLKVGVSDKVLISTDKSLLIADTDSGEVTLGMNTSSPLYSLDYHFTKGDLYYTQDGSIKRRSLNFSKEEENIVVKHRPGALINSIAVNWVHSILYWTVGSAVEVHMADLDVFRSSVIFTASDIANCTHSSDITYLDNILVDPFEKVLFMLAEKRTSDTVRKIVLKANLREKDLSMILDLEATTNCTIAIDIQKKKLYASGITIPQNKSILYTSDYDGGKVKQLLGESAELMYPIQVFLDNLFMLVHSTIHTAKPTLFYSLDVESTSFKSGLQHRQLLFALNLTSSIYDMIVFEKDAQMSLKEFGLYKCKQKGCSYQCVVMPTGGATCVCPAGQHIATGGQSCEVDPGVQLLISGSNRIEQINVSTNSSTVLRYLDDETVAVDFHYFNDNVFIVFTKNEVSDLQWYHLSLSEVRSKPKALPTLVKESTTNEVYALAVDWVHDCVYIASRSGTDSEVWVAQMYSEWTRKKILTSYHGITKIIVVHVDPYEKWLFMFDEITDGFGNIVRSNLEGESLVRLQQPADTSVTSVAIETKQKRIYFSGNKGDNIYISSSTYDFTDLITFTTKEMLYSALRMSVYGDSIFLAVKNTDTDSNTSLYRARVEPTTSVLTLEHLKTGTTNINYMRVILPQTQLSSDDQTCLAMRCSQVCEVAPHSLLVDDRRLTCACPENLWLNRDGTSCTGLPSSNCEKSVTTVNSKSVCKGELVFEDKFDTDSLDPNKWQHTVRISSDHENEFVIFDKDHKHTFIKDGHLVVKPSIVPNDIVSEGNISLAGCTTSMSHLCHKESFTYNIIPPVRSGLINTRHAFSFRYGTVTIRAKVPKGDWLYPVLNLQATKDFNNPNYRSGVIRIASVKGNKQLTCNGNDLGNKIMSAGVMLGLQDYVKSHFVNKAAEKGWSDDFHTFMFNWTPDELSFSVDDGITENILPEGKTLREALGFLEDSLDEWKQGTRITPLDQYFYLSIGVSVGGSLEFPDNCTNGRIHNSSAEVKPWRNFEVKSLLKFWQKESEWSQTWRDQPALLIDYVNVRAL